MNTGSAESNSDGVRPHRRRGIYLLPNLFTTAALLLDLLAYFIEHGLPVCFFRQELFFPFAANDALAVTGLFYLA